MILKEDIKKVIESQREELQNIPFGVKRTLLDQIDLPSNHAVIITGIRRCGKSTLLRQILKNTDKYLYFNFEDSRYLILILPILKSLMNF